MKGGFARAADIRPAKMLRKRPTAASVKPHSGGSWCRQWPLRAVSDIPARPGRIPSFAAPGTNGSNAQGADFAKLGRVVRLQSKDIAKRTLVTHLYASAQLI